MTLDKATRLHCLVCCIASDEATPIQRLAGLALGHVTPGRSLSSNSLSKQMRLNRDTQEAEKPVENAVRKETVEATEIQEPKGRADFLGTNYQ